MFELGTPPRAQRGGATGRENATVEHASKDAAKHHTEGDAATAKTPSGEAHAASEDAHGEDAET